MNFDYLQFNISAIYDEFNEIGLKNIKIKQVDENIFKVFFKKTEKLSERLVKLPDKFFKSFTIKPHCYSSIFITFKKK